MAKTAEIFIPPMIIWEKTQPRKPGKVIVRYKEVSETVEYNIEIAIEAASVGLEVI